MTLGLLFTLHGIVTLAAGLVLLVAPQLIPSVIGIELDASQYLIAYLLGAAELALAYLSLASRDLRDWTALRLICWTIIVFHVTTVLVEFYAITQGVSTELWTNIVVRLIVVALFAYYGLRKTTSRRAA